jgi:hypothetical protein
MIMTSGHTTSIVTRKNFIVVCLAAAYLVLQLILLQHFWTADTSKKNQSDIYKSSKRKPKQTTTTQPHTSSFTPIDLPAEIQNGLDYANSITNIDRQLAFVHIPKAAGSAIEEAAGTQKKLDWGSCLFRHRPKRPGGVCRYPPGQFEWPKYVGWWHLPPGFFPVMGINPYENADLFVVARNVTERLISEFYYVCRKRGGKECDASRMNDAAYLNEWLKMQLLDRNTTFLSANDYLDHNGHFTPQYQFVVSPMGVRTVDYVIRMEAMQDEFPALMQAYGLDIHLQDAKTNTDRNHSTDLGTKDISAEVLALIKERYRQDFEMLK